jgi:hypothetical protein
VYQAPEKLMVMELDEDLQRANLNVLTITSILPKVTRPHEFMGANPGKLGLWDTVDYCTALVICHQLIAKCES